MVVRSLEPPSTSIALLRGCAPSHLVASLFLGRPSLLDSIRPQATCLTRHSSGPAFSRPLSGNVRRHIETSMRTVAAFALAVTGTIAVYAGSFMNIAVLGTIGDALIVPGSALLAVSTVPIRKLSPSRLRYALHLLVRYLSLPVFCFGAFTLVATWASSVTATSGKIYGLEWETFITLAGLLAVTWPEVAALFRLVKRRGGLSSATANLGKSQSSRGDA